VTTGRRDDHLTGLVSAVDVDSQSTLAGSMTVGECSVQGPTQDLLMIWGLFGYRLFFAESNSASAFQNLIFIKTDSHGFRDAGDIAGEVTRKIEAECNQTPPWLPYSKVPFPTSPENLSKPNSLAGGILKCQVPNRPLWCYNND